MAQPSGLRTGPARWAWLIAGWLAVAVGTAGVVGCWYVGLRIPTRDKVLAAREEGRKEGADQPGRRSSAINTSRISAEGLQSGSEDGRR